MIAPLTSLLAGTLTAGIVAHTSTVMPHDLRGLPSLVAGPRGLETFAFNEGGSVMRADGFADLYLVTRLLNTSGKPDPEAPTEADTALGALLDLLPSYGFRPARVTQVEAHWGSREVIVCQIRVTRAGAVVAAPIPATT